MVLLSKVFTAFFLPPGCLIAGFVFFAALVPRGRRAAVLLFSLLAYLLCVEPVKDLLLKPLENAYPPLRPFAAGDAQGLVILGGGTIQASPEAGQGMDTLGAHALKRTLYAFTLRGFFAGPYIASGGMVFDYGQEAEAEVTARLLVSLGLPSGRVLKEGASRNTWQNAKSVAGLFGHKKIILVSSAYHMRRSVFCFENNGFEVIPAPTDYLCSRDSRYGILSFLPSMDAFLGVATALHEYLGILYYRLAYP
jgi:uncharacterized SAM-binding protein YcdF (DUF218 family)